MGCSHSDTSNQTAEKRERRLAKRAQHNEDSTKGSDETVSTNHEGNRQSNALADNALLKVHQEKDKARAKMSLLRQPRDTSPAASPRDTSTSFSTPGSLSPPTEGQPSPRGENPAAIPSGNISNSRTTSSKNIHDSPITPRGQSNPLAAPARNRVTITTGYLHEGLSDTQSVMGEVEMSSQVGRGSSRASSAADSEFGDFVNGSNPHHVAVNPVLEAVPSTYLPGGNRYRRIGTWIDGTKAFQVYHIQCKSRKGSVPRRSTTTKHNSLTKGSFHVSHATLNPTSSPNNHRMQPPQHPQQSPNSASRSHLDDDDMVVDDVEEEEFLTDDCGSHRQTDYSPASRFSCSSSVQFQGKTTPRTTPNSSIEHHSAMLPSAAAKMAASSLQEKMARLQRQKQLHAEESDESDSEEFAEGDL